VTADAAWPDRRRIIQFISDGIWESFRVRECLLEQFQSWCIPAGAKEAAEKVEMGGDYRAQNPQGLKPGSLLSSFAARLKSCPDTKQVVEGVFPQPVKPE
jgi:hypothetical protein